MGDYIERKRVIALIIGRYECPEICEQEINEIPAADVRPAARGRWRWVGQDQWNDFYECSQCGKMNTDNSNFCPNCGADMRRGDDDGRD